MPRENKLLRSARSAWRRSCARRSMRASRRFAAGGLSTASVQALREPRRRGCSSLKANAGAAGGGSTQGGTDQRAERSSEGDATLKELEVQTKVYLDECSSQGAPDLQASERAEAEASLREARGRGHAQGAAARQSTRRAARAAQGERRAGRGARGRWMEKRDAPRQGWRARGRAGASRPAAQLLQATPAAQFRRRRLRSCAASEGAAAAAEECAERPRARRGRASPSSER